MLHPFLVVFLGCLVADSRASSSPREEAEIRTYIIRQSIIKISGSSNSQPDTTTPKAKLLDEPCSESAQCPEGAVCQGTCVCDSGYVKVEGEGCFRHKYLEESCNFNLQCSTTTINSACAGGACACVPPLVESKENTCIAGTIQLDSQMAFDNIPWVPEMSTVGSAGYDQVLQNVTAIQSLVDGFVSVTNLTIEANGEGKALAKYTLTTLNPNVKTRRVKREDERRGRETREMLHRVRREDERRGGESEQILHRVKRQLEWAAQETGQAVQGVLTRVHRGPLYSFCLEEGDCTTDGTTCIHNTCTCATGTVEGGEACRKLI